MGSSILRFGTYTSSASLCCHGGHEGEEGVEDRERADGEVGGVSRHEGEDRHWPEEDGSHEEQDRQDREQEVPRRGQEGLRFDQGLDRGSAEGAQGAKSQTP